MQNDTLEQNKNNQVERRSTSPQKTSPQKASDQKTSPQKQNIRTSDIVKLIQFIFEDPDSMTNDEFIQLQKVVGYNQTIFLLSQARNVPEKMNEWEKEIKYRIMKTQQTIEGIKDTLNTFSENSKQVKFTFDPQEDSNGSSWKPTSQLANIVVAAGFLYDPEEDIIYSKLHPFQRAGGYCPLYDNAAPIVLSTIIDCEPVYFSYNDKEWMIEFWKGQYGMETGAEIGIYNRKTGKIDVRDYATGKFFECATDEELLKMSFTLYKDGKKLFKRDSDNIKTEEIEKHWWLTGFKWGEFTLNPSTELSMDISITFDKPEMSQAFVEGLAKANYKSSVNVNTISFLFEQPHAKQSESRLKNYKLVQQRNFKLVSLYNMLKEHIGMKNNDPNLIQENAVKNASQTVKKAYEEVLNYFKLL